MLNEVLCKIKRKNLVAQKAALILLSLLEDWNKPMLIRETSPFKGSNATSSILEFSGEAGRMRNFCSVASQKHARCKVNAIVHKMAMFSTKRAFPSFLATGCPCTFRHTTCFSEISIAALQLLNSAACGVEVSVNTHSEICTPAVCSNTSHCRHV